MLLMVEKGTRGIVCHTIHRYVKVNNKYTKYYDKNKESSHFKYWDINNLHGWLLWQKLPLKYFEQIEGTSQFNEDFIKSYNEESYERYFFEVEVQYLEKLHEFHNYVPFLPKRIKIEKIKNLVTNLHDKCEYVIHIKNLMLALNHGLVLRKVKRVIKFNQKAQLKPYININTKLRKKLKNGSGKDFFELINNAVLGKTFENMKKHTSIKLGTA